MLTFMPASQSNQLSWLLLHSLSDCFGGINSAQLAKWQQWQDKNQDGAANESSPTP